VLLGHEVETQFGVAGGIAEKRALTFKCIRVEHQRVWGDQAGPVQRDGGANQTGI
jgi:hypothetical protein